MFPLRQTYLGLLLPERKHLLLAQHPGNDHKAELASKLPGREERENPRAGKNLTGAGLEAREPV